VPLDRRSDVYSLGATLWELLTLRPLFGATDQTPTPDLMLQIQHTDPQRPRQLNPRVPEDLEAIVLKCLEKDRRRRYATAGELSADLSRWLRGEPVQAQPPTLAYLLRKSIRRHRFGVALVSSLVLAALLGTASILTTMALFRIDRARKEAMVQRAIAERAKGTIEGLKEELRLRLVQNVDVANGFRRIDEGDPLGSLVWFADALRLEQGDRRREEIHRNRLAATLPFWPRPSRVFFHDNVVTSASFSPDGRCVVTASLDKTARVWDAETGQPTSPPMKHEGGVNHVAFSPDGRRVVTASWETTRVWDAASGQLITSALKHEGVVTHAAFSPDGCRVVTASSDNTARVRDVPSSDDRDSDDWIRLAQMFSGTRIDQSGALVPITPAEFRGSWRALCDKYPDAFVASPREVLAWHYREADDCEAHGLWDFALGHLDHLTSSEPAEWRLYTRRARVYARLGRWGEFTADFTKAMERGPRGPTIRIDRGDAYAELGRWDQAAADFEKAVAEGAERPNFDARTRLAHVRLAMDNHAAYRQACADLLAHLGPEDGPNSAASVAWTCVLAPNAVADREALVRLAEQVFKGAENFPDPHRYLQTLAAASYRAGRFEEAVKHLDAGMAAHGKWGDAADWLLLALAHQRLGHADEARNWLDKAVRWLDASTQDKPADNTLGSHIDWETWLALRVLRREAEEVLGASKATP
jgi:tetratricopeptide (TPR) repeat protein